MKALPWIFLSFVLLLCAVTALFDVGNGAAVTKRWQDNLSDVQAKLAAARQLRERGLAELAAQTEVFKGQAAELEPRNAELKARQQALEDQCRALDEQIKNVGSEAAQVPPLEAEIAALEQEIANLKAKAPPK